MDSEDSAMAVERPEREADHFHLVLTLRIHFAMVPD
jgi:hypothetical protein